MLREGKTGQLVFDLNIVSVQHGGVGTKMCFACDALDNMKRLRGREDKIILRGTSLGINGKVFDALILNLDVFMFELYSVLDSFAVELQEIFGLQIRRKKRARDVRYFLELTDAEGLDRDIRQLVCDLRKQDWFDYFHRLRTRITHRMPLDPQIRYRHDGKGKVVKSDFSCLPDDPDEALATFEKEIDLTREPEKWLDALFCFADSACGILVKLMSAA